MERLVQVLEERKMGDLEVAGLWVAHVRAILTVLDLSPQEADKLVCDFIKARRPV